MITRLKVDGFKNLVDLEIYFGPFTCFAGGNGVGKSNIFDVLQFLSYLADFHLVEAIEKIRGGEQGATNSRSVRDVFRTYNGQVTDTISIEVDLIVSARGTDELGQEAEATGNFLRYGLELGLLTLADGRQEVQIRQEYLDPITKGDAPKHLLFPHSAAWRNKIIYNKRRNAPYISTDNDGEDILLNLHQDGGTAGRPRPFLAKSLPRTVLSTVRYASETPTALLVRREMQNWKFLQLEPSALRRPNNLDEVRPNTGVEHNGANLPGTVYRLSQDERLTKEFSDADSLYATLASRLSELIPGVASIRVDRDEIRRILTLQVVTRDGTVFPARSLSDGTLRFLALAILELDYDESGMICLEEPENGIHPARIPAMIALLEDIAFDPNDPEETYLRQVIVNTHSPKVIREIPSDALLYVRTRDHVRGDERFDGTGISALSGTWRTTKTNVDKIDLGDILAYLDPEYPSDPEERRRDTAPKVKDSAPVKQLRLIFTEDTV